MSSDDGLLFWSFGYEGSDYHLDDQGYVVQTEKGEKASLDYGQTGQGAWWMFTTSPGREAYCRNRKKAAAQKRKRRSLPYGSHERTAGYDNPCFLNGGGYSRRARRESWMRK
ncbi:MAG: hypothetical protein ACLRMZ_02975 [Blautia marasmi]